MLGVLTEDAIPVPIASDGSSSLPQLVSGGPKRISWGPETFGVNVGTLPWRAEGRATGGRSGKGTGRWLGRK